MAGSVLETFLIMFESDASDAKQEVEGLDKALDDTDKSATKAVDSSDKAGAAFLEMGKSALGAVAGVFALGSIIQGTLAKAADIDELGKFSRVIGENVGDVNAWEQAVIRAGGSADSFRASVESLNEKVVDAAVKGTNEVVPFFNQLGISIVDANGKARSTLDLLPELADAFEGLSEQESAGLGKRLGLDQGTILLLQSGRREVEALVKRQKELGVVSEQAVEVSEKFNDQLADLKQVLEFTSQSLLISFLPAVTSVLEVFTEIAQWIGQNQVLVEGFFIGIGLATLKFAIPPIITLATAVWAAVAPFLVIGLAIAAVGAAFALIYEDVVAFMNGQESMIGQMEKRWPIVGDIVRNLVAFIKNFISAMSGMAEFLWDIFTAPTKALEKLMSVGGFVKDLLGFGDNDAVLNAQQTIEAAGSSGIAAQTSSSIQNSTTNSSRSTQVNTGDIVIQTSATDADGIASDAAGSLDRQLRTTVENFDDGVAI